VANYFIRIAVSHFRIDRPLSGGRIGKQLQQSVSVCYSHQYEEVTEFSVRSEVRDWLTVVECTTLLSGLDTVLRALVDTVSFADGDSHGLAAPVSVLSNITLPSVGSISVRLSP